MEYTHYVVTIRLDNSINGRYNTLINTNMCELLCQEGKGGNVKEN